MKRFSVRTLILALTAIAIVVALCAPHLWRLNATSNIDIDLRLGHQGYPRINAICFYNPRARVIVLHKVTSESFMPRSTNGRYSPVGYPVPWLEIVSDSWPLFDCKIAGRRVFIDDTIQFFYAVDDAAPKFVRIAYSDFASIEPVAMLDSNEDMWDLCMRFAAQQADEK